MGRASLKTPVCLTMRFLHFALEKAYLVETFITVKVTLRKSLSEIEKIFQFVRISLSWAPTQDFWVDFPSPVRRQMDIRKLGERETKNSGKLHHPQVPQKGILIVTRIQEIELFVR